MTPKRFSELLAIYGGDIRRWPAEEREAAQGLADADAGCREALGQEARVDAALEACAPVIGNARAESMVAAVMRRQAALVPDTSWLAWLLAPRRSAVYVGLFVLGCACNVMMRVQAAVGPLDLWFNINLRPPWGG